MLKFDQDIIEFLNATHQYNVRMILIGGGAVNFHGYQRHSSDLDFWIDMSDENLNNLLKALNSIGIEIHEFPDSVKNKTQNITIKISPLAIELITNFNVNKTFEEVMAQSVDSYIEGYPSSKYQIISLDDLITSKIKSYRAKDQLDIIELKKINDHLL